MTDHRHSADLRAAGPPTEVAAEMFANPAGTAQVLYPELVPVITLAVDAVMSAFEIDIETDSALVSLLERVVAAEAVAVYAPMAAIAAETGRSARQSRSARAAGVARTTEAIASQVAAAATALQVRDEVRAARVARHAVEAAELVAALAGPDPDPGRAAVATQVAAAVRQASAAASLDRMHAAAEVGQAAAAAAIAARETTDLAAVAVELEVFATFQAARTLALNACYQAAVDAATSAIEMVLVQRNLH